MCTTHHVSHVMRNMSGIRCHISSLTIYFFLQSGGASWCYQLCSEYLEKSLLGNFSYSAECLRTLCTLFRKKDIDIYSLNFKLFITNADRSTDTKQNKTKLFWGVVGRGGVYGTDRQGGASHVQLEPWTFSGSSGGTRTLHKKTFREGFQKKTSKLSTFCG